MDYVGKVRVKLSQVHKIKSRSVRQHSSYSGYVRIVVHFYSEVALCRRRLNPQHTDLCFFPSLNLSAGAPINLHEEYLAKQQETFPAPISIGGACCAWRLTLQSTLILFDQWHSR